MTEKVKITQKQADAIEFLRKNIFTDANIIEAHAQRPNSWVLPENESINGMSLLKLVDALRIGYEVEPEYEKGDWVAHLDGSNIYVTGNKKIVEVHSYEQILEGFDYVRHGENGEWGTPVNLLRHATPEEIKAEKDRRWWAKHGRDVWELKQGDVLMATRRTIYEVTADPKSHRFDCYTGNDEYDFDIEECKRDNWKVICFHENRKDVRHA